jgi:hypothetical protein
MWSECFWGLKEILCVIRGVFRAIEHTLRRLCTPKCGAAGSLFYKVEEVEDKVEDTKIQSHLRRWLSF